MEYIRLFVVDIVVIGFGVVASRFNGMLAPSMLLVFFGLSAVVSFVAF